MVLTGERMSDAAVSANAAPQEDHPTNAVAAVLSYLIPGLGQIYQGRIGKGLLFFVCVYTLFFVGGYIGSGTAHIKTKVGDDPLTYEVDTYVVSSNVYLPDTADQNNPFNLPHLLANLYNRPQFAGQFWVGIAAWPAVWQYLNFDKTKKNGDSFLGDFERTPSEKALNAVHTSGDKLLELGWVFTVIAGVLNVMVIYDALAGPAFPPGSDEDGMPA
jgi:TM2 domain-containing membrane protein YozV